MQVNGFSSAVGLMGQKRGQHQQQSMMMMMPLSMSTSDGYNAFGGEDCDQIPYRNIRMQIQTPGTIIIITELFFDLWLVTCKWIGQKKF